MPALACPTCTYNLEHLEGEDLLECPECGATCTKREAMAAPYARRNTSIDVSRALFFSGTALIIVGMVMGAFTPWAGVTWWAWALGHAVCLAGCVSYARHNTHGFGAWWPAAGVVVFLGWTLLVHGVMALVLIALAVLLAVF